jgi:DNA-binding beta-propeller fold protein YncE
LVRTLTNGVYTPDALAFDPAGNLYVANCGFDCGGSSIPGTISVYSAGTTKLLRTISQGIARPGAILFSE